MTKRQEKKRKRMTRTELEKSEAARFGGTLGSTQRSVDSKSKAKNDCGEGFRPSREGIPAFAKAKKAKKSHILAAMRGEGHHEPKNGKKKQQGRKGQKMPRAGKRKAAQKKTVRLPGKSAAKKKAQTRTLIHGGIGLGDTHPWWHWPHSIWLCSFKLYRFSMRGGRGAVVPALPHEKVVCCSVRWSWCCLFGVSLVMIPAPPPVGRPRRTIAVPTLSSTRYPNIEALPT